MYDYLFAAHQSIMGQKQSKMSASDSFASNLLEGWKGEDHFVCKGISKRLIMKFNPEQKNSQKMQLSFCMVPAWIDRTKPTPARGKKLHYS